MTDTAEPFFQTSNIRLATALALAGIPWLNPNEPVQTEYDANYLEANGCKTVEEARRKGKPGRFAFHFKRVPELKECMDAFDAVNAEVEAALASGKEVAFLEQISPIERMNIAARAMAVGKLIKECPLKIPAFLVFWKEGDEEMVKNPDGSTSVRYPGFTRFRMDAPAHIKERLRP